jgi:glutathione S-transferase
MADRAPLLFKGVPGSPYTRKMAAVLRYRRLPYHWLMAARDAVDGLPEPKVNLLPTFYFPDQTGKLEAVVDSTPLIRRFEAEYAGRNVVPDDPALAFIDALIEDYADEWLTKAMFHYRWYYAQDAEQAARLLPRWVWITVDDERIQRRSDEIKRRQIERLYVVGSNDVTAPVIEASYARFLNLFDAHLTQFPYVLGHRPGAADFGIYGQLTQLALFDPTPMALTIERAPRVYAWTGLVEDLSGLEPGDWFTRDAIPNTLRDLLGEIGRVYAPFLIANARALQANAAQVETEIDGARWVQQPFPYQGKCLMLLRQQYDALPNDARASVDAMLDGTGCESLFR